MTGQLQAEPRYAPLGDAAVTIVLGDGISRELSRTVLRVAEALSSATVNGVLEVVPAYASLAVFYDPRQVAYSVLLAQLRAVVEPQRGQVRELPADNARTIRIPVRYDGEDLPEVAEKTGHTPEEVVALHAARDYLVYVIGFVPGFAYLGELDPSLVLPRRSTPRKRVPPGSVAIAEAQTAVYPFSTPGGWHLIGTTDVRMFDSQAKEPSLLRVGDTVRFDVIS
jgi:inhibitor of KinA